MSRKHARILHVSAGYVLEDLGSTAGTLVNGAPISAPHTLTAGDAITVGPVVFGFQILVETGLAGQQTRILDNQKAKVLPKDRSYTDAELELQPHRATTMRPGLTDEDIARLKAARPPPDRRSAAAPAPAPSLAPAPPRAVSRPGAAPRASNPGLAAAPRGSAPGLSAADRARARRVAQESLGGQLLYFFSQLSPRGKLLAGGAAAVVFLALVGGLYALFSNPEDVQGPTGPEPSTLSIRPIDQSFGYGQGVNWERVDQKVFDFEFTAPTRAVVVLHYRSTDLSEEEVSITINGQDQGFAQADVGTGVGQAYEVVLPAAVLKRGERNVVIFDNVKNPPGEDTWRIQDLWIEVVPIPEMSPEQTLQSAHEFARKATDYYEQREVGSANLFNAWKNYRFAWLTLEALEGPHPPLYDSVRFQMKRLGLELDQKCATLMLAAEKAMQLKQPKEARVALEDVPRHFPTNEHACHNLAKRKLVEYDL